MNCNHYIGDIEDGPRIPARWGTHPTEICTNCGMWRNVFRGLHGDWRNPPLPTEDDDEC